jgi:Protein of unknown function (DUF1565)
LSRLLGTPTNLALRDQYIKDIHVVLYRNLCPLVLALFLMACGSSDSNNSIEDSDNFNYYVDVSAGDDSNPGSAVEPFKTITKALSVAVSAERIKVRPGLYDYFSGEVFPLRVPAGVELIGNEDTIGLDTKIDGGDFLPDVWTPIPTNPLLTALLESDSVFAGFSIDTVTDVDSIVLYLDGDGIQVHNNSLSGLAPGDEYSDGIVIASGSNQQLIGNTLEGYSGTGLKFESGAGSGAVVQDNIIVQNQVGVFILGNPTNIDRIDIDLGGGTQGGTGSNILSCNTRANLIVSGSKVEVDARGNFWDHAPPTRSTTGTIPVDIYLSSFGPASIVNTGSDQVAASACN